MKKWIGKTIFKLAGWKYQVDESLLEDKQVIIGFEHTSNLDAILAYSIFGILDLKAHVLIKQDWFRGPMKPIMTKLGGIPVDRSNNKDVVGQMVDVFAQHEKFTLVIAPEATRAKNGVERKPIRTGFWHIAKAANVPIVLIYAHAKTKKGGLFAKIYPTDLKSDLIKIKQLYAELGIDVRIE